MRLLNKLVLLLIFCNAVPLKADHKDERLEFVDAMHSYFEEELQFPDELHSVPLQEANLSKVEVTTCYCQDGKWQLRLIFPKKVEFEAESTENSLLISFNQPIETPALIEAQSKLDLLLDRFVNGYRTLYLQAKNPLFFTVYQNDYQVIIEMIPDATIVLSASKELKISRARLLMELRHYRSALSELCQLLKEYPYNQETSVLLADLEGLLPRWQRNNLILQSLRCQHPCDDSLHELHIQTYFPHKPYLRFTWEWERTIHLALQALYTLSGEFVVASNWNHYLYLGGRYGIMEAHISSVFNNEGIAEGFLGNRSRGEVWLRDEFASGDVYQASFYISEGDVYGAGIEARWLWPFMQGDITVWADWHKPYWELFEAFPGFGREDRIKFDVNFVYNRCWYGNVGSGVRRVGIIDVPNGYTSILGYGNIFWNWRVPNPIVALNYAYDAEYVQSRTIKRGIDGNLFQPVPLQSFEFHTVRLYLFYEWKDTWYFSAFGGEVYNRLGTHDWTAGLTAKYEMRCPCGWEVELNAMRFPSTTAIGAVTQYVTISVTARF